MGWAGAPAAEAFDLSALTAPAVHFEGTAREAALRYPKNANVAAAVALAGLGFEETRARLVADPGAVGNMHEIEAEGAFGRFRFEITGASLPDNPRSSALAAMSALAEIRRLRARVTT
jgi:aspartate dehydrogenase